MNLKNLRSAALGALLLSSTTLAQTSFPESEPNSLKSEADLVTGIVAGDTIDGSSTGSTATLGSTLITSADVFRVQTTALSLGIYKHRLTITTTGTAGHTGTIRGVTQTGTAGTAGTGGTRGTTDATVQTTSTLTTPARFNQWYGFGKQEEIYYRVTGGSTSTAAYVATLSTTTVAATPILPVFESANPITITTIGQTTAGTMIHVLDSNFDALPGYSNDDEGPAGPTTQSRLTRSFAPGTYYLSVSSSNTAWDKAAPADDDVVTGALMDFSGSLVRSSTSTVTADWDFTIVGSNGAKAVVNQLAGSSPYDVTWYSFAVALGAPHINDACADAFDVSLGGTFLTDISAATNDGAATCDPGGLASKDVWAKYTNGNTCFAVNLNLDTCSSTADTALSVHTACGGAELACNDDCGGTPCGATSSCLTYSVPSGQTVWIRVSDKGLGGTTTVLNVNPRVVHDDCATPIVLAGPGLYCIDDSVGATMGTQGQASAACNFTGGTTIASDLWYTYTAAQNGTATVSTCGLIAGGATEDSKIGIYAGAGCPAGTAIACDDDSPCTGFSGLNATIDFPTTCGSTYTIQIGSYAGNANRYKGMFSVTQTGPICATPSTPYCSGDGTDTACPCANPGLPGRGCNNTVASGGAGLTSNGIASITGDTLVLSGNNAVPFGPGLYYQGSTPAAAGPPFGVTFGNGLRCAGGMTPRLEIRGADGTGASSTTVPIHVLGSTAAGDVRYYQLWYRDSPNFGACSAGFNLSSALSLTWGP